MNDTATPTPHLWLARYAKLIVLAAFVLLLTGGHTTTSGAGMAFPDWPLSNGSLNPAGWLTDTFMFLEHSHRLTAGLVATMTAVLLAWVWVQRGAVPRGALALAVAALLGVLAQAVLGGLRVILDPQGIAATTSATANTFRVLHACFAQLELCLLVVLAARLSPVWRRLAPGNEWRSLARLAWFSAALIFLQLIVGASMRHLGAGLAIPTFPQATASGGWLPETQSALVHLHFTHTRVGALLVVVFVAVLAFRVFNRSSGETYLVRPAALLLALTAVQVAMGILVIWQMRPPILTTLHVVNGAAVLATTVLLAVRASREREPGRGSARAAVQAKLTEAHA